MVLKSSINAFMCAAVLEPNFPFGLTNFSRWLSLLFPFKHFQYGKYSMCVRTSSVVGSHDGRRSGCHWLRLARSCRPCDACWRASRGGNLSKWHSLQLRQDKSIIYRSSPHPLSAETRRELHSPRPCAFWFLLIGVSAHKRSVNCISTVASMHQII